MAALLLAAVPSLAGARMPSALNVKEHTQSTWHVNMTDATGMLMGVSPVAARVTLENGEVRTFAISHGQYEKLKGTIGDFISFNVHHDVLYTTNDL